MARETAEEINDAASLWAVRSERGLSQEEQASFDAWLAGDSRRLGAYGRMAATLKRTERASALGPHFYPTGEAPDRRRWLIGAGALAASVAGFGLALSINGVRTYRTRKGEKKVVALDDGSVVTLNTATRLEVRYSEHERLIRLAEGEALFDVSKDAARPFIVQAGEARIRAVGTSFTVARVARLPVQVLVREGVVDVTAPKAATARLAANMRAVVASAAPVEVAAVGAAEVGRDLAWRDGRIIVESEALGAAAARFDRYSDIRVTIDDPALAAELVSGVFQTNDPITFARSMALSLNARAEVGEGSVRIVR